MKYRPLFGNILVKPIKEEEAIIIAGNEFNDPTRGEVIEISSSDYINGLPVPLQVRPKMIIHFRKRDATPIKTKKEDWYVLNQHNILLVEED